MKFPCVLGGLAVILIVGCASSGPEVRKEPVQTFETVFENNNPEYKALSDRQRVVVLSRRAAQQDGYDRDLLTLVTFIARRGDAEAQYVVGMVHKFPFWRKPDSGIEQDTSKAHSWFLKAAGQGHPYAAVEAAEDLLRGDGVAPDRVEALRWYEAAAEADHAHAQYMAGYLYLERSLETNNQEDADRGMEWIQRAAENGDEEAVDLMNYLDEIKAASDDPPPAEQPPPSDSGKKKSVFSFEPVTAE
jgi:TPR repeat protein